VEDPARNGTRVNGRDVREGRLRPGDRLEVGNVLLRFDRVSPSELAHLRGVLARLGASDRDPLTGLLTRAYLDERLPSLLARSARKGRTSSALFVDVDRFKRINDRFSRRRDDVLRQLARLLLFDVREREVCIRYGGEELLIILEGADEGHATAIAERLRKTIESHDWARLAKGLVVTISCGIAERQPREPVRAWLARADGALYAAKRRGRNRVLRVSALPAGKKGST
jgi:diguanylate cyclase (GGDEF)-like protein